MAVIIRLDIVITIIGAVFYLFGKIIEKVESRKKEKEWVRKRCLKSN